MFTHSNVTAMLVLCVLLCMISTYSEAVPISHLNKEDLMNELSQRYARGFLDSYKEVFENIVKSVLDNGTGTEESNESNGL
ncbi:hypothetical protein GDO86_011582 [Hymenochirus boettgeri]|uniref:Secreted protein n=1 Tax=Hymenochirus boettgeri TaxID=247094 RepID=A0A8T2JHM4_9PIPI|nr:hypothetical protein GDO86_011582 [Hymenochirus boettgeri]